MSRYLAQRLLSAIPTLVGVSILTFLFIRLLPGDAIAARLGTSTALSPEQLASLRAYFGLDQPLHIQYWSWLASLFRGDAGYSIRTGRPVLVEIAERLPATLELAAAAALIAVSIGLPLGLLSAMRPRSRLDVAARVGGLIGLSLPSFWLGTLIVVLFSLYLRWLPNTGGYVDFVRDPLGNLKLLLLPAITLGLALAAATMRMTRSARRGGPPIPAMGREAEGRPQSERWRRTPRPSRARQWRPARARSSRAGQVGQRRSRRSCYARRIRGSR